MTERRRRRTGCLTCRARHVKCDERKPECERCEAGNIECAGYLPKKQIEVRESQRRGHRGRRGQSSSLSNIAPTPPHSHSSDVSSPSSTGEVTSCPHQLFRSDGLPLVGLPSNPRPSQRPLAGAREVLAYHQFLFRTLPILFPPEHLWFWKDKLCEEGWGIEFLYMTFSSLGSMHRAVLMMSMPGESDQNRGLDTKVIAIQSYTFALQELSRHLEEAKKTQDVFIATLILMAYFECFSCNFPAAYSHIRSASYYFELYKASVLRQKAKDTLALDCLETALQNLNWMCFMALPLQNKMLSTRQALATSEEVHKTPTSLRQNLLHILAESGLEDLIWNLVPRYSKSMALAKIYWLQQKLRAWRNANKSILTSLASDMRDFDGVNEVKQEDPFLIPPPLYPTMSPYDASAALCSFLLGRTFWLLSILEGGVNSETHKRLAYLHFYETLRFAVTDGACKSIAPSNRSAICSSPLPCEDLEKGMQSMLYIIGQCSPEPSWLLWITQLMKHCGRQGPYNGLVYAASLETWHSFEVNSSVMQDDLLLRYPDPPSRTISVLIPSSNGTDFITYYYAKPAEMDDLLMSSDGLMYYLLGDTHLSRRLPDGHIEQNIHIYHQQGLDMELFTPDWLQSQAIYLDWQHRSLQVEFDLNRILEDHINGSQFLMPSSISY
ncbi:hypothetical protein ACQKWADRAFT_299420 [Trichoderma austrokoningii]